MKKVGLRKAAEILLGADDIVIFTHFRPDFDTIGSAKALEYALRKLGKRASFVCSDELSERFSLICDELKTEIPSYARTAVCVDMATDAMLGKYREEYKDKILISIDHHAMDAPYAQYTFCRPKASATGELIFDLCRVMGVKQDKTLAKYLYCAISSDSGCFKFGNTTAKTHLIAAELLRQGIDAAYLNRMIHDHKTARLLALEALALKSLSFHCEGKLAVMAVTEDMCAQTGADVTDIDALVQLPRTIDGVEVGITLKQIGPDNFKVSVRSNDYFDATKLAGAFGGGGHIRASGFCMEGDVKTVKAAVVSKTEELL